MAAQFLADILLPAGVLDGVGYPFLLPLIAFRGRRTLILASAILCTALTLSAHFIGSSDGARELELLNRAVAIFGIWIMAVFLTERLRLEEDIERAKNEAEQSSRSKSEFLANMSHELRTPLNAVIGFAELIKAQIYGPLGSPKYVEYAGDILDSGGHLLALINDVLDISRAEAGKLDLHEEIIDIASVVKSSISFVTPQARYGNIHLTTELDDGVRRLRADEVKFRQVLINLLSNGIKFTPSGGTVSLSLKPDAQRNLTILVADTGIGMSEEDIPRAFEIFRQIDSKWSRQHRGAGLGLPLSKRLVELHGGTIDIISKRGRGTQVTVTFPASRVIDGATAIQAAE